MQYQDLGNTGLLVSRITLGTMTFGGIEGIWKTMGGLGQTETDAFVKASLEAGVNFIDTADIYSLGESEKVVGQALKNLNVAQRYRDRD